MTEICGENENIGQPPFIRDKKDGYLLISVPLKKESYKEEMLQKNKIEGIVQVKIQTFNEHSQYRYETGNHITLAEQYNRAAPGTEEISELMRQIEDTGKVLENYLLTQEDMLLSLNDIYLDGNKYYFLYLPDYGKNIGEQLSGLFEELMNCMNYEDRASVSLVYLLHARIRQKGSGIPSLRRLCEEILESQREEERVYLESRDFHEILVPRPENQRGKMAEDKKLQRAVHEPDKEKDQSLKILQKFKKAFIKAGTEPFDRKKECKVQEREASVKPVIQKLLSVFQKGAGVLERTPCKVTETAEEFEEDTVLLGSSAETVLLKEEEKMYALEPMDSGRERIVLTGYPFELGKERGQTKHFRSFLEPVISRRHAQIVQQGGRHYVIDLNSLNGTTVNGERLTPKVHRELKPGDMLGLAEIYYIFTCLEQQDDV